MTVDAKTQSEDWWKTSIIRMEPNVIEIRGHPIEDLIGNLSFVDMIWLSVRGDRPSAGQSQLLEAALTAAIDHGPQAPSIAAARMAASCGVGLNNAMATGVNMLGDVHGGAGEQAVELYNFVKDFDGDVPAALDAWKSEHGKIPAGFRASLSHA